MEDDIHAGVDVEVAVLEGTDESEDEGDVVFIRWRGRSDGGGAGWGEEGPRGDAAC